MDKLPNISKALNKFGKEAVEAGQLELGTTRTIRGRKVRRVATDTLRKSLYHQVLVRKGKYRVVFGAKGEAENYASFVHEGVNGTRLKVGSKFSFKKPVANIGAVRKWIETKGIRPRAKDGKFLPNTESNKKALAFVIARSIAQKGIVGVPYMELGVIKAQKKFQKEINEAMGKDIDLRF